MSQDLYIDYNLTNDIEIVNGQLRLCDNMEEITRQRLEITLRTFKGEWFANNLFGVPYFEEIFGKTEQSVVDLILEEKILSVEGVKSIDTFESELDKTTRQYKLTFKAITESGEIISVDVAI